MRGSREDVELPCDLDFMLKLKSNVVVHAAISTLDHCTVLRMVNRISYILYIL